MFSQPPLSHSTSHVNVMELLVAEEVEHQLQALPVRLTRYLQRSEIETFALNRLPALYAASEKGLEYQRIKAQQELQPQITRAVRQAFAAVQGDPLRVSQPLAITVPQQQAEAALTLLQQWMKIPNLTWDQALKMLGELQRQKTQQIREQASTSAAIAPRPAAEATDPAEGYTKRASDLDSTALRPGVYGCRTAWIPKHKRAQSWQRDRG